MLRVAIPNKGILSESSISILREAGYSMRREAAELHVVDEANQIEFFYLRPRDIATYVGEGSLDAGITGLDLLLDSKSKAVEVADLGFGGSTFRFAVSNESIFKELKDFGMYKDIFKFGEHDLMIPFDKLDDKEALQQIDLTYFLAKCREILKHVYDNNFKTHSKF